MLIEAPVALLSAGLSQAQPVILLSAGGSDSGPHELYCQSRAARRHVHPVIDIRRPHSAW